MRRFLAAVLLLVPIASAHASSPSEMALVVVTNPEPTTAARLLTEDVTVVRDMERYLLVAADRDDLARMERLGLRWELIDRPIEGKTYYTVAVGDVARLRQVGAAVRVLWSDRAGAVVEGPQTEVEKLAAAGFEIARVFMRPIRLAPEVKPPAFKGAREADPQIQAMVDAVSGATIDAHVQRLQDFVTRYAAHDSCQAAANWIKAQFESYGIDSVYFHNFSATYKDNVVAVIPGKGDPNKIFVIGGHYDSITSNYNNCPGADDNATGTVCALECARILSSYDFTYTLVFIAFGGEELGLYGSEGYASDAAARGDDIVGMVSVDMIGYLAGGDVLDLDIIDNAGSQWMRDLVGDVAATYVPDLPIVDGSLPGGASSDHASFWAHGYDAILFFEDSGNYSPYIHTTSDIVGLSYNSPTLAERSVKTAVALMATMAEPFKLAVSHAPLENTEDTTNPYRVAANIVAAGTLNPDSLLVRYSTGTGENTVTMTPTGNPDEYEAYIPAQPGGTFVDYYLVAEDTDANRKTDPPGAPADVHTFFVGTITAFFEDDFETDKGWTAGIPGDDATTGMWERCDPQGTEAQPEDDHTPAPGVNAYITQCAAGTSQGSYDIDGGTTTLLSPIFDLGGYPNVRVRYYRWYSNDTGSEPGTDYWVVSVSDDSGSTWENLENTNETRRDWTLMEFDVGSKVDLTDGVQFRFVASDLGAGSLVEAGVDDFSLVTYQEPTTDVADGVVTAPDRIVLAQNVPNPFNPLTTIRLSVPHPGERVTLTVYDVSGRRVITLLNGELVSGVRAVQWDGRNDQGAGVAAGIYFYRLHAGDQDLTRKMVLVK